MQCLVSLMAPQNADRTNLLEGLRLDEEEKESQEECSEGEDDDNLTVKNFIVKGSFHEECYKALCTIATRQREKRNPYTYG